MLQKRSRRGTAKWVIEIEGKGLENSRIIELPDKHRVRLPRPVDVPDAQISISDAYTIHQDAAEVPGAALKVGALIRAYTTKSEKRVYDKGLDDYYNELEARYQKSHGVNQKALIDEYYQKHLSDNQGDLTEEGDLNFLRIVARHLH
jgi:hypothetical protein